MADLYKRFDPANNRFAIREGVEISAGAASAGQLPALNAAGLLDFSVLPDAPVDSAEASEAISAGQLVNVYDDAGTTKMRLADATSTVDRPATGVAIEAAAVGETKRYTNDGSTALTGLTAGLKYFLDTTAGGLTTAPDVSVSGNILQCVGSATDASKFNVEIGPAIYVD